MDKRIRILVLISLLILWGVFLFFFKIRDLEQKGAFNVSFLMRNLSWQTDFLSSIPYKKWDEVEYSAVLSTDNPQTLSINIEAIKNIVDIEQIEYNDQSVQEWALKSLRLQESGILKIKGKTKSFSDPENNNAEKAFVITPIKEDVKTSEKTPEAVSTENTWSLLSPSGMKLSAVKFNSNISNLLTIRGKNLSSIEFVNIGGVSFKPVISGNELYIQIDQDVFGSWEYFLFYQLKNGKVITPNTKISFEHSSSTINIANITPTTLKNDQDRFVVIQGNGFDKIVSIQLSNNLILKNAEFNLINKHVAGVKIPKWLPTGTYYFNIMDITSIYELKNMPFTITAP